MTSVDFTSQTTIVTGASSGIGAAFARALAKRGSDVMLVARRLDRLRELANELERDHGVRATPIALDLSRRGAGQVGPRSRNTPATAPAGATSGRANG